MGSINEEQESDSNSAKLQQQQSSSTTASGQKSGKEGSKGHKPPFSGLKKLIDRDKDSKDKDKDKDDEGGNKKKEKEKGEKELSKAASVIKSGLNDTKENMKKLIGKDKQSSKALLQQPSTIHDDSNTANNGDVKNSPLVVTKRSSDVLSDGGNTADFSITNVTANDGVNNNNNNNNGNGNATHGIMSPFDSFNSEDSSEELDNFTHHQLSTSSSASVNIMMDNNTKNLGNVQVSQV